MYIFIKLYIHTIQLYNIYSKLTCYILKGPYMYALAVG